MAIKNVLTPYQLVVDGDMSGNITSGATSIRYLDTCGIQLVFTGTPTGSFYVDATIDGSTWEQLDFGTTPTAVGADGHHLLNLVQAGFDKIRVRYVASSGAGVLQAWVEAKEI